MNEVEVKEFHECTACGKSRGRVVFTPDKVSWGRFIELSRRKYQGYMDDWPESLSLEIRRCCRCGHYWHHTQPDFSSILGMYKAGVSLKDKDPAREPSAFMRNTMISLYRLSSHRHGEKPDLLDYGSGRGRWTRAAADAGFRVTAYEPSASRANEGAGVFPVVNQLEDLAGLHFDVVNLEQVLEHVQEPLALLKGLAPYLKPDSLLRISVPDISRIASSRLWDGFPFDGQRMHILSPYEHLQGFTPDSFAALLNRAGLIPELGFVAWRTHSLHLVRVLAGRWLPHIATTQALVRLGLDFD